MSPAVGVDGKTLMCSWVDERWSNAVRLGTPSLTSFGWFPNHGTSIFGGIAQRSERSFYMREAFIGSRGFESLCPHKIAA